jgi:hypothetical protein
LICIIAFPQTEQTGGATASCCSTQEDRELLKDNPSTCERYVAPKQSIFNPRIKCHFSA